ncbi:glycosyltransferase [Corynebacterium sp. UMB6689]|uniref:glycosyltransferase n=1 Tax=Corynebacterium sp. UMB6689 TaxID=3046341 RepID=UPI00254C4645|nr:glycosyltransferase [Corynebacterium sp. UMB6689]MDK6814000.1 glycosyltransferase [Corynebacterium sp. UMB6689]
MSYNFLGHTRFSLYEPNSSSWRMTRQKRDDGSGRDPYREALFDEHRLRQRAHIFFEISLPILDQAAKEVNLVHVVSYSDELPSKYKAMLEEASERYSWIKLDLRTSTNRKGLNLIDYGAKAFGKNVVYGVYRLDDDDILAPTYFEQCSKYLKSDFAGMVVSLAKGIQAFYSDGEFFGPRIENRPKIALGLLKVCKTDSRGRVLQPKPIAHPRTDEKNPVILDARQISYVHTMHLSQDSGVDKPSDDLGKRYRNYRQLPEASVADVSVFPTIQFNLEDFPISRSEAVIRTHLNHTSLINLMKDASRVLKRRVWLLKNRFI